MRGEQKTIVRWMQRHLKRLQWKPERWAREAHLAPTTLTRAMAENYNSVSSVPTLHALARAAAIPSILDFLDGQATIAPDNPILTTILDELLPAVGCHLPEVTIATLAAAVGQVLAGMTEQGENSHDPELARILARAARARLHQVD